ncbi:SURF5-domain-containing protein [Anaeromyces robustus]|uniref:SURF5-domain-containing protein n=1 Tax=Anaeromyces robustus TaxID=1754192 RepID=A0A1Y1XQR1_9FUNG|nr:SURF5-domain-containing protein [Anaeromyces robustus]|eukprot:ORX88067.1 SURF5-domain-containing protein [Anaeromyces robustus]
MSFLPVASSKEKKNKFVQNEEEYNKRLDSEIDQLIDSFHHIIKASMIGEHDKYKIFQEEYLINCMSSNIIRSAQSLLSLVSELKQSILLYDYKSLNSGILSRIETIEQEKLTISNILMSLCSDIRNTLKELEDVQYSSISFDMNEKNEEKNEEKIEEKSSRKTVETSDIKNEEKTK